jgi:serine/threonine-protein kinase
MPDVPEQLSNALADRYTVEREVGAGGMASVYLAHDLRHDRKVAVKVLRPELAAALGSDRFLREIKITANLSHPHILPLLDSGKADSAPGEYLYYVMPYVAGGSLRFLMDREAQVGVERAIEIAGAVANALDYAHRQNIVHRDIKPENILLHEGEAMVADFGIALAVSAAGGDRLTETGMSLGTPEYMSPEQVAGERDIDNRSDLYSLACVLYELLAGNPPFTASTAQAVMARHVADPVPPITTVRPGVSTRVAQAIDKALAKAPADRFGSAHEFGDALVSEAGNAQSGGTSLAVLPFANLSADPENEYFSDGVTEEIINAVAKIPGLQVTARTSAFAFKGKEADIREVAQKLGVGTVLEGSVRRAGSRIRITAQLINASDGYHIWSDRFDRELEDVFALQDEIAELIADRLTTELVPMAERHSAKVDVAAYDAYLRGRYELNQFLIEAPAKAIACFEDAIARDPEFALPYAAIAEAYTLQSIGFALKFSSETMPKAKANAEKALSIDPGLAEAHLARALVAMYYEWDYPSARRGLDQALRLNPNSVGAHMWNEFYWTYTQRDYAKAQAACERALQLDPLRLDLMDRQATINLLFGHFDLAIEQFQSMLDIQPEYAMAHLGLADTYCRMGNLNASIDCAEKAVEYGGRAVVMVAILAFIYAVGGKEEKARVILAELQDRSRESNVSSLWLACVLASLDETDPAFDAFERAREERDASLLYLTFLPKCLGLHGHPRFEELARSIGLGHLLPITDPT